MRAFTVLAFDEVIATTGTYYYTSASLHAQLGSADGLTLHAITTMVSGTVNLNCRIEHSANGDDWRDAQASNEISITGATNFGSARGVLEMLNPALLTFVRVRVWMTSGTQVRVKLYVTGHISQVVARQNGGAPNRGAPNRPPAGGALTGGR